MSLPSLAFLAIVFGIGALVLQTGSIIPLSILASAAEPVRYMRFGPHELPLETPGAGRLSRSWQPGRRPAITLVGADAR